MLSVSRLQAAAKTDAANVVTSSDEAWLTERLASCDREMLAAAGAGRRSVFVAVLRVPDDCRAPVIRNSPYRPGIDYDAPTRDSLRGRALALYDELARQLEALPADERPRLRIHAVPTGGGSSRSGWDVRVSLSW